MKIVESDPLRAFIDTTATSNGNVKAAALNDYIGANEREEGTEAQPAPVGPQPVGLDGNFLLVPDAHAFEDGVVQFTGAGTKITGQVEIDSKTASIPAEGVSFDWPEGGNLYSYERKAGVSKFWLDGALVMATGKLPGTIMHTVVGDAQVWNRV
jgi:hypothetical protein